jgi:hypothetical protein
MKKIRNREKNNFYSIIQFTKLLKQTQIANKTFNLITLLSKSFIYYTLLIEAKLLTKHHCIMKNNDVLLCHLTIYQLIKLY